MVENRKEKLNPSADLPYLLKQPCFSQREDVVVVVAAQYLLRITIPMDRPVLPMQEAVYGL